MKKMFRLTAILAAASLAAGLMVGCSTVPSSGDSITAAPTDTVLLLEQGDGMPALTNPEDYTENINTVFGSSAALIIADGQPQVYGPVKFNVKKNNEIQQNKANNKLKASFVEIVKEARAQVPETDILTSVNIAARVLNAGTAENKQIMIFHSGVSTASSLPMADINIVNEDPVALVDQLKEAAMIPDLEGVSVEWYGAGDTAGSQPTLSAKQTEAIKAFWSEYFNRAKASLTFHSDVININGPALTEFGHTVTPMATDGGIEFVKITNEQIAFRPDSVEFADEAAASTVLNELAEQIRTSSSSYVVAGSVAKVDGSTTEGAIHLSLARAKVVRDCLVAAGVDSGKLICYGLGFEATDCRSSVEEENRCVFLVQANTAQAAQFEAVGQPES